MSIQETKPVTSNRFTYLISQVNLRSQLSAKRQFWRVVLLLVGNSKQSYSTSINEAGRERVQAIIRSMRAIIVETW